MNRAQLHSEIQALCDKGIAQKDAFARVIERCEDYPFTSYSSYRGWKHRNGKRTVAKFKCVYCGTVAERTSATQKKCKTCNPKTYKRITRTRKRYNRKDDEPKVLVEARERLAQEREIKLAIYEASKYKECVFCGDVFKASNGQKLCSKLCTKAWRLVNRMPNQYVSCRQCGSSILRNMGNGHRYRYCNKECESKYVTSRRKKYKKYGKALHKDRCNQFGKRYEKIARSYIFKRDNYICYICKSKVDHTIKEYSPMMATIDHVVPLSRIDEFGMRYGHHIKSNIRTCCITCNSIKSDKDLSEM